MIYYVILVISLILNVIAVYSISNLIRQNERLEEITEKFYTYFENIREKALMTQVELSELDIRGVFESDDEVGITFKNIKEISDELTNYITEIKNDVDRVE